MSPLALVVPEKSVTGGEPCVTTTEIPAYPVPSLWWTWILSVWTQPVLSHWKKYAPPEASDGQTASANLPASPVTPFTSTQHAEQETPPGVGTSVDGEAGSPWYWTTS